MSRIIGSFGRFVLSICRPLFKNKNFFFFIKSRNNEFYWHIKHQGKYDFVPSHLCKVLLELKYF